MTCQRLRLLLTTLLCAFTLQAQAGPAKVAKVSMINLIATPERFHGKRVAVAGVLRLEFEGTVLYFHREDYENLDTINSVWLSIDSEKARQWRPLSGKLVFVVGTFRAGPSGYLHAYTGDIAVDSLEPLVPVSKPQR